VGSQKEQKLYRQLTPETFLRRLILKRPLSFLGPSDTTLKLDGERLWETDDWLLVGNDENEALLKLEGGVSLFLRAVCSSCRFVHFS
jgi:hypothetical protein